MKPQRFPLSDEDRVGYQAPKDRHRWCKGRVGRDHEWAVVDEWELSGFITMIRTLNPDYERQSIRLVDYCTRCGRHGQSQGTIVLIERKPESNAGWRFVRKPQRNRSADDILRMQSR